jgi:hypothetical protein
VVPFSYYWSTYQHEWALDVVFHHAADLRHFYPRWVNHAMTTFSSPDVMRFLGKHINPNGQLHQNFSGEVITVTPWSSMIRPIQPKATSCAPRQPFITPTTSAFIDARRGTAKGLAPGVDCAGALPTYTAEPSSPTKPQHGIWTLSLRSTTPPPSTNCSSGWNNHGNGAAVGYAPSVAWPMIGHYCRPLTTASSLSMASAIAISAPSSFPRLPTTKRSFAVSYWISRKLRLLRAHALITKIVGTHRYQLTSTGRKIIVAIFSALRSTVAQLTLLQPN